MTPADLALDNAIHFEGVKHAYRQTRDGVVISFVVHPHDVPKGLADASLGSRYIVALVQVGDDEQPVPAKETAATPRSATDKPPVAAKREHIEPLSEKGPATRYAEVVAKREKMDWRELQPAAQAGIRCEDPVFQTFLKEEHYPHWSKSPLDAAVCVRLICGVESRSELGSNHRARVIWKQLDDQFYAWRALERT